MKPDIFIHSQRRLHQKTIKYITKSKQSLKSIKIAFKQTIRTIIFYNSEIKFQYVRFRNNLDNINRF